MLAAYFSNSADRTHKVIVDGANIPAEVIALMPDLYDTVASARELKCHECRGYFSALELYKYSDVPGECQSCADDFFQPCGCHPDDECQCS